MKAFVRAAAAIALGAALPVLAQAPVPPSQLAKPAGPPPGIPGVSPAGMAALNKLNATPDPVPQQIAAKVRVLAAQLTQAAQGSSIDVDKLAGLLKQRQQLQSQVQAHNDDRLLGALRALPPGDRAPFLKALNTAAQMRQAQLQQPK